MTKEEIVEATKQHVKQVLSGEGSGHDWWHVYRVWNNAKHIGQSENVDMFVVELTALLHDIADYKLHGGDETIGPK
nr:phosphohydrolase [Candidatus Magasanikbacteria bacterium]